MTESSPHPDDPSEGATSEALQCDFCGDRVMHVRRIVLDGEYERLQTRHVARYACESCSDEKERQRLGMSAGNG